MKGYVYLVCDGFVEGHGTLFVTKSFDKAVILAEEEVEHQTQGRYSFERTDACEDREVALWERQDSRGLHSGRMYQYISIEEHELL